MTPQELVDELCDAVDNDDMCYRSYLVGEVEDLCAENAKLREELSKWERLTAGIDLPEYPVTQFKPKDLERENAKLRELVVALYHVHFGTEEESWDAWEDFCPCSICEERHGGEAPCAYTSKDLADECCEPITKEIVIDRMRELGVDA